MQENRPLSAAPMLENNQTGLKPGPVSINNRTMMVMQDVITHTWDNFLKEWVELPEPIVFLRKLEGYTKGYEIDASGNYVQRGYMMPAKDFKENHREL